MQRVTLEEAGNKLEALTEQAARGEEVVILRADGSAFKLVPLPRKRRIIGVARGQVELSDDFDAPLEDFGTSQKPSAVAR